MVSRLLFLLSESFRALFRAKVPAIISSITIAITLIVFSIAFYTFENLIGFSNKFTSQFSIEVFFDAGLIKDDAIDLFNQILLIDGVELGEFIDKEKASNIFKLYFKEDIQNIIGENPLPMGGNFEISPQFRDSYSMQNIANEIRLLSGVNEAVFQQGIVSKINRIVENMFGVSLIIGLSILFISVILVSNTIRLIIHSKRITVEILHLIGATNMFIKFPFILEGIFQGLIGSVISLLVLTLLYKFQIYLLDPIINIKLIVPNIIIPGNIILGSILGFTGSYRGISKYLR